MRVTFSSLRIFRDYSCRRPGPGDEIIAARPRKVSYAHDAPRPSTPGAHAKAERTGALGRIHRTAFRASASYTDPAGDSQTAPDITLVVVGNENNGMLRFDVETPGNAAITEGEAMAVGFDSNNNPATGSGGDDYVFIVDDQYWSFERWTGTTWDNTIPTTSIVYDEGNGFTLQISMAEAGISGPFGFWVGGFYQDSSTATFDFDYAPDIGQALFSFTPNLSATGDGQAGAQGGPLPIPRMTQTEAKTFAKLAAAEKAGAVKFQQNNCTRAAESRFRCVSRFTRAKLSWAGTFVISYASDAEDVYWDFTFSGTRTDNACRKKATTTKARKKCTRKVSW